MKTKTRSLIIVALMAALMTHASAQAQPVPSVVLCGTEASALAALAAKDEIKQWSDISATGVRYSLFQSPGGGVVVHDAPGTRHHVHDCGRIR